MFAIMLPTFCIGCAPRNAYNFSSALHKNSAHKQHEAMHVRTSLLPLGCCEGRDCHTCTGYGLAARFLGRGGGTTFALPDFSSFRKYFCAWLRTCGGPGNLVKKSSSPAALHKLSLPGLHAGMHRAGPDSHLCHAPGAHMVHNLLPVTAIPAAG